MAANDNEKYTGWQILAFLMALVGIICVVIGGLIWLSTSGQPWYAQLMIVGVIAVVLAAALASSEADKKPRR